MQDSKPISRRITWCTAVPKLLVWTQRQGCHRSMVKWYVAVSHVYWTVPCHPHLKVMKEIDEALHQKVQTCLNSLILKHLTGRNHTWVEILCLYHEHQVQSSTYLEKSHRSTWSIDLQVKKGEIPGVISALTKLDLNRGNCTVDWFSPLPRHGLQARDLEGMSLIRDGEGACLDVFCS